MSFRQRVNGMLGYASLIQPTRAEFTRLFGGEAATINGRIKTFSGYFVNDYTGDNVETIISHYKTLDKQPISMRVSERLFFNLNAQKTAVNDNEWEKAA